MAIVDQSAMYRAGLSRGSTGRNPQAEARLRRQQNLTQIGIGIVGTIAEEGIKYGVEQLKEFKAKKDSQTAARNLSASKIPEGNPYLENDLLKIYDNIKSSKRALRKANTDEEKKAARASVRRYEKVLTNFNADLTTMQSFVPQAQGTLSVEAGTAGQDNKGGSTNISPAATTDGVINLAEQANGRLGKLMFWDHDNDVMRVIRGGRWTKKGDGTESYENLGIKQNKELKKKYSDFKKDFLAKQQEFQNEQGFIDTGSVLPSYKEWAQEQNQNTLRTPTYSEIKFAKEEDRKMMDEVDAFMNDIYNAGYTDKQAKAKRIFAGKTKGEVFQKIDGYKEDVFKAFFFGGPGYNYSDRRATNESMAHLYLMSRNANHDFSSGIGVDDGDNTNNFIPPGSPKSTPKSDTEWQGALTALKFQDMGPGTPYRQIAQEYLWSQATSRFESGGSDYITDNPDDGNNTGTDGRTEETKELEYVRASRLDSQALEDALKTFDINDLQGLKITEGFEIIEDQGKAIVRRISDGMNMTPEGLNPNDRRKARNILYRYMPNIRTEHRKKGEVKTVQNETDEQSSTEGLDWENMSIEEIMKVINEDK